MVRRRNHLDLVLSWCERWEERERERGREREKENERVRLREKESRENDRDRQRVKEIEGMSLDRDICIREESA